MKKKRKESSNKPFLILGLLAGVLGFGIFTALMIMALSLSGESTMLQMELNIPAWILVAMMAFAGLVISLNLISFFEHSLSNKAHEKQLRQMEKKIDMLVKDMDVSRLILKDPKEDSEALPYEQLDDFVDYFVGMSDAEIENVASQLLNEDFEIKEEDKKEEKKADAKKEEQTPQIIPFQNVRKQSNKRRKTGKRERRR